MPYIPAIAVGTVKIAARAASWRVTTPILCASRRLLALEDRGQDKQEAVDHGLHAVDMVRDVVEIWCHFGADAGKWPRTSFRTSSAIAPSVRWNRVSSTLVRRFAPPLLARGNRAATVAPSPTSSRSFRRWADTGRPLVQDRVQHIVDTFARTASAMPRVAPEVCPALRHCRAAR